MPLAAAIDLDAYDEDVAAVLRDFNVQPSPDTDNSTDPKPSILVFVGVKMDGVIMEKSVRR